MVQVSTDYVFDGTKHTPYSETDPTCPDSVYGRTKLEGEQLVRQHCERAMIVRTAWLYSIFGNNFVKTMIRLGKEKTELGVIFDQIGTPTYARDLAVAIMTAVEKGIIPGIYQLTVYRRTNPGFAIVNTNIRLRSGYSYTLAVLGTFNDFSVQMLNA